MSYSDRGHYEDPRTGTRYSQRYFYMNGYQYWVMEDVKMTDLMNRAVRRYEYKSLVALDKYDHVAAWESEHRQEMYGTASPRGHVLDVGCGTGLLVDYRSKQLFPYLYTGIDISEAALGWFGVKHPSYRNCLVRSSAQDFHARELYDTVLAMFGSGGIMSMDEWRKFLGRTLAPSGRAYIMPDDDTIHGIRMDGDGTLLDL